MDPKISDALIGLCRGWIKISKGQNASKRVINTKEELPKKNNVYEIFNIFQVHICIIYGWFHLIFILKENIIFILQIKKKTQGSENICNLIKVITVVIGRIMVWIKSFWTNNYKASPRDFLEGERHADVEVVSQTHHKSNVIWYRPYRKCQQVIEKDNARASSSLGHLLGKAMSSFHLCQSMGREEIRKLSPGYPRL